MNPLTRVKGFLNNFQFGFNDDMFSVYAIVMFLFIVSPILFVKSSLLTLQFIALVYVGLVIFLRPKVKRLDISDNWLRYVIYFALSTILFSVLISPMHRPAHIEFQNIFTKFLYSVFVIGFSESLIRQGLLQKTGNSVLTNTVMALGHVATYTAILGVSAISFALVQMLLSAFISFFVFEYVNKKTDTMVESEFHGMFDYMFY